MAGEAPARRQNPAAAADTGFPSIRFSRNRRTCTSVTNRGAVGR